MGKTNWSDDTLLSRAIKAKTTNSRWSNISKLRKRPSKELFLKCYDLTKSKVVARRSIGIDILAQFGITPRPFLKETLKLFFELLDKENSPKVLMSLLSAIGHNNDRLTRTQIDKLCSFSNTDNEYVKEGLVFSLLSVDNKNAIDTLIRLSSDRLSHVRDWSTFGIGSQVDRDSKKIREALWKRINDKDQNTKLEALVGLARRKDKRIVDVIRRELNDGEYGTLLYEAITEIADESLLLPLQNQLRIGSKDGIAVEWLNDLKVCVRDLKRLIKQRKNAA
jgi:HEAT repeat protein